MKTRYILGIVLAIVVLGAVVLNTTTGLFSLSKNDTINIGVVATITGVGSYQGQQELRGLQLAVDEINANNRINGKKVNLIIEDSQVNNEVATKAINKLIEVDKVKYVIGDSWSSTTEVIVPIINKNKIILISPITTLDALSKEDYFFRTIPTTKEMMNLLANYAYNDMNIRTLGILRQNTLFGFEHSTDFKIVFEKLGGKIIGDESFALTDNDLRAEITKIKDMNPDAIFNLHATGPMLGLLMKQAQELGVNVKWIGSWGSENGKLVKEYGSIVNDLTYAYPFELDLSNVKTKKFVDSYEQKYNELPDLTVASSYDSLYLIVKAIELCNNNTDCAKQQLENTKNFDGVSGNIAFDKNGDVIKPIIIKEIKDGKFVKVSN